MGCCGGRGKNITGFQENTKVSRREPGIMYIFEVQKLRRIVEKDRKLSSFAIIGN